MTGAGPLVTATFLSLGSGAATVTVADGGAIDVGSNVTTIANAIHIGGSGSLQGAGAIQGNVVDDGHVTASVGTLYIAGALSGTGNLNINANVTLELAQLASFSGAVIGFAAGAAIDLTGLSSVMPETVIWTQNGGGGTLTISNGNMTEINLVGSYSQDNFSLTSDIGGGTKLVWSPTTVTLAGLSASGNAVLGQAVTVSLGAINLGVVTYSWLVDGQVVQAGMSNTYTPILTDQGKIIDVIASFTNPITGKANQVTGVASPADPKFRQLDRQRQRRQLVYRQQLG